MRPIHDADAVVLMATALASKRRPAELREIVAAADLLQGAIPFVDKLAQAIQRLSAFGLIHAVGGGIALTPPAIAIMADLPRRAGTEALLAALKDRLAAHDARAEFPPIRLGADEFRTATLAHKSSRKSAGGNLLMPKPKPDRHFKVDGRWRRVSATRGRKP